MPLTLAELSRASELAQELSRVTRDLKVIAGAWKKPTITTLFVPVDDDHNGRETVGPMHFEVPIDEYRILLTKLRGEIVKNLEELGVNPK